MDTTNKKKILTKNTNGRINLSDNKHLYFILKKAVLINSLFNLILLTLYCIYVLTGCLSINVKESNFNFDYLLTIGSYLCIFVVLAFSIKHFIYFKITRFTIHKLDNYVCKIKDLESAKTNNFQHNFNSLILVLKGLSLASFSNKNTLIEELKPKKRKLYIVSFLKLYWVLGIFVFFIFPTLLILRGIANNLFYNYSFFAIFNIFPYLFIRYNIIFFVILCIVNLGDLKKIKDLFFKNKQVKTNKDKRGDSSNIDKTFKLWITITTIMTALLVFLLVVLLLNMIALQVFL